MITEVAALQKLRGALREIAHRKKVRDERIKKETENKIKVSQATQKA